MGKDYFLECRSWMWVFNNRINASMEYYVMPTTDMIMNQSLPDFTGFNSITTNLGRIENRGFELSINSRNIEKANFQWEIRIYFFS